MDTFSSCVMLTPKQAKSLIEQKYKGHFDYSVALEQRKAFAKNWNKINDFVHNKKLLFELLTSPVGTTIRIETTKTPKHDGETTIKFRGFSITHTGQETTTPVDIASTFAYAKSYGWFMHKMNQYENKQR